MRKWRLTVCGWKITTKSEKEPNAILHAFVVYGKHCAFCIKGPTFGLQNRYKVNETILILFKGEFLGTG